MVSTARSSSIITMVDYHSNGPGPPKAKTPFGPRAEIASVDICLSWLLLFLSPLETKLENNDRQSLFLQDNQNLKDYEIVCKVLRRMIDRFAEYPTHSMTEHVKGDAEAGELAHDGVDDSNGDVDWQAAGNPYDPMATTCHPAVATRVEDVKELPKDGSPRWKSCSTNISLEPAFQRGPAPKASSTNYNSGILEEVELSHHFFQNAVKKRFSPEAFSTNYNSGTGKSGSLSTSSRMPSRGASCPMLAEGAGSRL
ncbi:hypothetical protein QBC37DRAFT_453304 [Rhypophila decipiens]|uniref:Uncharacterized protein n=1 Tax=Rhypophila decipiens TaxID=261697 RepID=A0AAN7B2Y7_9PEZI|nr:hypothetical protein QBC37DRAFT_453304 [Rhypophila decipiens]